MKVLYFKTSAGFVEALSGSQLTQKTIAHHHLLIEAHIEVQILNLCIAIHKLDNKLLLFAIEAPAVITIKCPGL